MPDVDPLHKELATWLLSTDTQRTNSKLPLTLKRMAEKQGVSARTLRRWLNKPEVEAEVERQRLSRVARNVDYRPLEAPETDPALDTVSVAVASTAPEYAATDDMGFSAMLAGIQEKAEKGDLNAAKFLMQTVHQPRLDAMAAAMQSDFRDMADADLDAELLSTIPTPIIISYLVAEGYRVSELEGADRGTQP